jgi:hypothetical protein
MFEHGQEKFRHIGASDSISPRERERLLRHFDCALPTRLI